MKCALINGRVLLDQGFTPNVAVVLDQGRITGITREDQIPPATPRRDLKGAMLLPGFIDTQVNGGGGVLFNSEPTVEGIAAIGRAHRRFGTTGFMPTLISDDLEGIEQCLSAVDAAIAAGVPGVLGIHVEGPFLNVKRKGIHRAEKIRKLDEAGVALLSRRGHGRRMITIAPEQVDPLVLARLVDHGLLVCAGHTNATYAVIRQALDQGLRGFTHLFNAMTQLGSREPGVVGAALADDKSWCGIIVDGVHVSPVVLKLALRCSSTDRFMLVTDAMPSVGTGSKSFTLQGEVITVEDGVCLDSSGTLAGSDLNMASAVRNSVEMLGLDLPTAVRMASRNPAEFLGLGHELGRIAPGYRASLVLADDDLNILESWIDGEPASGRVDAEYV